MSQSDKRGGRKRDAKDVKRKRGGAKAATSKDGKPRSTKRRKVKQAPVQAKKRKARAKAKRGKDTPASGAGAKAGKKIKSKTGTKAKERRGLDRRGQGARSANGRGKRTAGRSDSESTPLSRVAVVVRAGRHKLVEPVFGAGPRRQLDLGGARGGELAEGDLVLLHRAERDRSGRARVERLIGRIGNTRDVLEALMLDRGLAREFPDEVEAEAEAVSRTIGPDGRVDLRDLVTFTIDPRTAKDFDDAISAERVSDRVIRVWVHIADVSAFVRPGSQLDAEARRRSTSVYVPGSVEPMLPHRLSSGACSLRPGEDRLAVTVKMDFDGGDCVASEVLRTIIRSDERLDYDEVDRILLGEIAAREPWATPLDCARAVSTVLAEQRRKGHALTLDRPEPEFVFDRDGSVSGWQQVEQTESHRLIEMLMVAANSQVARKITQSRVGALHRVHERPDPEAVDQLLDRLESLGIPTPPAPDPISPSDAVRLVAESSALVDHWTRKKQRGRLGITTLVLRALAQARYDREPLGHSGLGLADYCHFTSPIRRYPDIVCHRAVLSLLGLEDAPSGAELAELGEWTSAKEREAMVIERDADDIVRCFLLTRELEAAGRDQQFEGEIVGVIEAGLFVDFGGGFEGFLPVRRLAGGWWELSPEQTMLVDGSGRTLRLGDRIKVQVGRVDAPRGRCDLYPVAGAE